MPPARGGNWWADDAVQTDNPTVPFLFTGRRFDAETQLYYYRARYYDPRLGRFIGRDPIGYHGSPWNLYEYVSSQPLTQLDPTGAAVYCAGGKWNWVGWGGGMAVGIGGYRYSAKFTCAKSKLVKTKIYSCPLRPCEIEKDVYKVPVAEGYIRVFSIGLSLGIHPRRYVAGQIKNAFDSDVLSGFGSSTVVSISAGVGGGVGGSTSGNSTTLFGGPSWGVGASAAAVFTKTVLITNYVDIHEEPWRAQDTRFANGNKATCTEARTINQGNKLVDTPETFDYWPSS